MEGCEFVTVDRVPKTKRNPQAGGRKAAERAIRAAGKAQAEQTGAAGNPEDGKRRRRRSSKETEAALLASAAKVFGEKGFVDATIDEIVARPSISRGAFYLYFTNKEDIFRKLLLQVVEDLLAHARAPAEGSHRDRIERANRSYMKAMHRNRLVLRALIQVQTFNGEFSALYGEMRSRFILRIERDLRRKLAEGYTRQIDPRYTSYYLGLMVEAVAYAWVVNDYNPFDEPFDFDLSIARLTDAWCAIVFEPGREHEIPERPAGAQGPPKEPAPA